MGSSNPFTLELLQAINDWQRNSNSERGKKLHKLSKNLDSKFKTVNLPCYRKINLEKGGVFSLIGRNRLNEKISSWSTSPIIASGFKGGVSRNHLIEQSIILQVTPHPDQIILNLSEIYKSVDFHEALELFSEQIVDIDKGIKKYGNSQHEVVLRVEYVNEKNVYMIGGRSSEICVSLVNKIRRPVNSDLLYDIEKNKVFIFKWLSEARTRRVLNKIMKNKKYPYNVLLKNYGYKKPPSMNFHINPLILSQSGVFLKFNYHIDLYSLYFSLLDDLLIRNLILTDSCA